MQDIVVFVGPIILSRPAQVLLFAAGTFFFGLGGVAAKELHGPYNMQVGESKENLYNVAAVSKAFPSRKFT